MSSTKAIVMLIAYVCALDATRAETTTYSYDAQGRLVQVQTAGGPGSGVTQTYQYDSADNRVQYQVAGSPAQNAVTLSPSGPVVNATSAGVSLTVNVSGSSPSGTVTFTENGVFLGTAWVTGGQASLSLNGFPLGVHSITATYSGDGVNASQTATFSIKVQNLNWLPAVLQLLLSN